MSSTETKVILKMRNQTTLTRINDLMRKTLRVSWTRNRNWLTNSF